MPFGGSVKLTGEKEYKQALSEITQNLKVLGSEMRATTSLYANDEKSTQSLRSQKNILNSTLEEQKKKVDILKEALAKSEEETGKNSKSTKDLQVALNNAQTAVNKTTNEIENLGKSEEETGTSTLKLGDLIKANITSEAIIGGIKAVGSAMKDIGMAIVDVSKQAISNFSEYEQLVGGVETLFKGSSDTVQNYANNAYKTAGLSANEYMSTVTSFSASLLQSLNGDTEKSATVADMAITDMADNANKMGTSMESIQTAYQGFAKQNYTMLDNLKLGYGGTKTEMERLLKDATALSDVEYDINNLNDVYQAIHVVQTELGVTGTTAKEASETITGSVSAMKTSWDNLLTGLANGNANMGDLVNNVINSALTVADNILPVVEQVANSIVEVLPKLLGAITEKLPTFLEKGAEILTTLIQGISNNMPAIVSAMVQILNSLVTVIISNLPTILQAGITILMELVKGIAESLPSLIPAIVDAVILMVETLINNIDLIIDAGIQLVIGLAEGLIKAIPKLIEKIPILIAKLIDAIVNNLPKIIQIGIKLVVELAAGLIKAIPELIKVIPQIIGAIVKGFAGGIGNMALVGIDLVKGLWNGIANSTAWIIDKIKGFGQTILNGIKVFFGIHSPSTLFEDEVGKNLALGVGLGFEDTMKDVTKQMQEALPTSFNTGINANFNSLKVLENGTESFKTGNEFNFHFNVQKMDESNLNACFNYINARLGVNY